MNIYKIEYEQRDEDGEVFCTGSESVSAFTVTQAIDKLIAHRKRENKGFSFVRIAPTVVSVVRTAKDIV